MKPDHLCLHSLLHVGEEASVGRDRSEDDLPGVGQDPAQGLQAGAHSVEETEVSCGDGNFSSRDSLGDKLCCSREEVWRPVQSVVMLPFSLVVKQVTLMLSYIFTVTRKV